MFCAYISHMNSKSQPRQSFCAVKPNPNVIFRRLDDEVVLFHVGSDRFYELNGTAARFWELLNEESDPEEVRRRMLAEFDVDADQFAREADALITTFREENLVTTQG